MITPKVAKKRTATQSASKKKKRTGAPIVRSLSYAPSNKLGGPFPVRKKAQLVYTEVPLITLSGGVGSYVFRANDLFDPNVTGTGTQPLYFDQIMAIYNHFVVTSSFIEIQPLGGTSSWDLLLTTWIDDDVTFPSTPTVNAQRPGAKFIAFNPGVATPPSVRMGWNAAKNFGPGVLNNSLYRGSASASPTEQMFYVMQISDIGLSAGTIPVRVRITYNCEFTELKTIAAS